MAGESFEKWLDGDEQAFLENLGSPPASYSIVAQDAHHATKGEILAHWQSLPTNRIIQMQPIPFNHKGSTYSQDAVRVTGTRQFIDSIISRIKDITGYEGEQNKLDLVYRDIESSRPENQRPNSAVFYVMARQTKPKTFKVKPTGVKPPTLTPAKPNFNRIKPTLPGT